MDISMKSLTHHTLTVAFHSLALKKKKKHRWLLPSVFCTIFVVVVDVDLHAHFSSGGGYIIAVWHQQTLAHELLPLISPLSRFKTEIYRRWLLSALQESLKMSFKPKWRPPVYKQNSQPVTHSCIYARLQFDASTRYHSTRKALQQQRTK